MVDNARLERAALRRAGSSPVSCTSFRVCGGMVDRVSLNLTAQWRTGSSPVRRTKK